MMHHFMTPELWAVAIVVGVLGALYAIYASDGETDLEGKDPVERHPFIGYPPSEKDNDE